MAKKATKATFDVEAATKELGIKEDYSKYFLTLEETDKLFEEKLARHLE